MTREEKLAEQYAEKECCKTCHNINHFCKEKCECWNFAKKGFIAGYKANELCWHDLEKDPDDLPKDYKTMCICLSDYGSKYESVPQVWVGCHDSLGWSDYMGSSLYSNVRFWCELPIQIKEIKE